MDEFDRLLQRYNTPTAPLPSVKEFADIWAKKNASELERTAALLLNSEPGTTFEIQPVLPPFIAFPSQADKDDYEDALFRELRHAGKAVSARAYYDLHVTQFITWVRRQLEEKLAEISRERDAALIYHEESTPKV